MGRILFVLLILLGWSGHAFAAAGKDWGPTMLSTSTRFATALRAQAEVMNTFHLPPPTGGAPQKFATLLQQKAALFETYVAMADALSGTPRMDVFYEKLAGQPLDLRAMIENADETLMKATPIVFGTLVSANPDSEGYVSRLNITTAQRAQLVHDLDVAFGEKLKAKNQNRIVLAAAMLKDHLSLPLKCSDEP